VEHLLRDIKDSTTTTLSTRVAEQLSSLRGLHSRLSEIRDYLKEVAAEKHPVNHQVVYHLQDALNLLPALEDPEITKAFVTNGNDQLLVVYLSSLVRAVIALHALVDNKAANGRAELEEGKSEEEKKKGEGMSASKSSQSLNSKDGDKGKDQKDKAT
jgi:26S proteasome regulatory subunit N8